MNPKRRPADAARDCRRGDRVATLAAPAQVSSWARLGSGGTQRLMSASWEHPD
jgi:hypothetical protein